MNDWVMMLLGCSPFLLGALAYFIYIISLDASIYKARKEAVGTLTDSVEQMTTLYESPLDQESDNKMTEPYECPHCGAQNQTKVICEYCRSRNERKAKKNSINQISF